MESFIANEEDMKPNLIGQESINFQQGELNTQERLEALFNNTLDAILMADDQMRFVDANPAACTLTGYDREELLQLRIQDITPSPNLELLQQMWRDLLSIGTLEGDFEILCKGGDIADIHFRAVANNLPGIHMAIFHDVTAQKLANKLRHEIQARMELVLTSITDSHILFDREWRYIYVNEAAARAIRRPRAEILGNTLWNLYPDILDTELEKCYLRAMNEQTPMTFEFHYLTTDTWWENHFYPAPEGLAVFATEITERKQAEARLREYEKVVEELEEMIVVIDREYRYVIANQAFLDYRGMKREQIIGQLIPKIIDQKVFEKIIKEKLDECFQGKVVEYELKYTYPHMGERDLFLSYLPVEHTDGIDRVVCILRDITERKKGEAEREQLFEELRQSHEQLRLISGRLVEAEESERKRLAREIHDDISQALTALTMRLGSARTLLPKSAREARSILKETETLTQSTLEHTRSIIAGLRPSILDEFGLIPALRRLADELRSGTSTTVILKTDRLPKRLPPQVEITLFRIAQEALTNVRKHAQASEVNIRLRKEAGHVYLSVQDNGVGMDNQAAGSRQNTDVVLAGGWKIPASHFGLIGMQERVKLLNGDFQLTSAPHQGTTIRVELPL
jgi:PAS domain S-box-containing protein